MFGGVDSNREYLDEFCTWDGTMELEKEFIEKIKVMSGAIAVVSLLFLMVGSPGYGQQSPKDSEKLKAIAFLVGEWDITVDARLSKKGPWEKSKARLIIKKAIGDTILDEELTGNRQQREWVARCWIAVDNRTSHYQWAFVDSDHGVLELYEGSMSDDSLVLEKEIILPQSKILRRIIYSGLSPDSFTVRSFRSADNGITWDLTGTSRYERVQK